MQNVQYAKLPSTVKESAKNIGVMALWAKTACLISNPQGFTAPFGGIKKLLKKYSAKSSFEPTYRAFVNKYFKQVRISYGENKFQIFYELYQKPCEDIPPIRHLNAADGREYVRRNGGHTVHCNGHFTLVSMRMLCDPLLSLGAQGLGIEVKRAADLMKNAAVAVTKTKLMKKLKLKRSGIDAEWKQLISNKYLLQERLIDDKTGLFSYAYELFDTPRSAKAEKIERKSQKTSYISSDNTAHIAKDKIERKTIKRIIRENIEYTKLVNNTTSFGFVYRKEDVDGYVKLITDVVCSSLPTVKIGGESVPTQQVREQFMQLTAEHILYVMDMVSRQTDIVNPRAYKLTALYRAADTVADYGLITA